MTIKKTLTKKSKTSVIKEKPSNKVLERIDDRKFFGKEKDTIPLPNLIEVQLNSYKWFLNEGVQELLDEISPITDFSGKKIELHFLNHYFEPPKYDARTSQEKNLTYEAPLKAQVQLINKETGEIKEQHIFLGPVPYMTDEGTFIINGNTRVVVNQIVRSPGVFFSHNPLFPKHYNAKIIPKRGIWIELETDKKGIISAKIDRKRKIPITVLLRIFGFKTDKQILDLFADITIDEERNYLLKTLQKDSAKTVDEALILAHKRIRPGDLANAENARTLIESMFFDYKKYDFGKVARYKVNKRFALKIPNDREHHTFQVDDFILILRELIKLNNGEGKGDDIDHLSNRRVRSVGELVQNKFRVGLARTVRICQDRITVMDLSQLTPNQLINSRPITAALKEFFASSQLSQFMDQTNPLAALAHKRRLSAMGPGGLSRERASFEVRDVHPTHYGRICPIETPEGPNIGLVGHMASYGKINEYGFIETPYRIVTNIVKNNESDLIGRKIEENITLKGEKTPLIKKGEIITESIAKEIAKLKDKKEIHVRPYITHKYEYYAADEERNLIIAEAGTKLNSKMELIEDYISARQFSEAILMPYEKITHIDVSSIQTLATTTALIPFTDTLDSVRGTMGCNMKRQAVSLVMPKAPIVGTGMERIVAENSGQCIVAKEDGVIIGLDASHIDVLYDTGEKINYILQIYERSNQATCMHQRVNKSLELNMKVKKGAILADGASTENGELALGSNLLVAYLSWDGYNFEDAIILSSRIVKDGDYDSIHIEDYVIDVRDTKLGPELVTRDIPNVGESRLKDLDENGIVRIGATVRQGDILVGKITPKGETELTAEERLLRAIFGDKARDVKDTSLRLPGGTLGKVVRIQSFNRADGDELPNGVITQLKVSVAQRRQISVGDKLAGRYGNKGVVSIIVPAEDMPYLEDGTPVDIILNPLGVTSRMNIGQTLETHLGWAAKNLGFNIATPAINGISSEEIQTLLKKASLPAEGKVKLFDGRTGSAFDRKITVGYATIMKLNHLVEDKIHARSVGPYSLVTQQPLGGKAQSGGQRFGEMEVWALEAYGAAHTLQEMLTIKSDDVIGRTNAYESIIKNTDIKAPAVPESFNVLIKELQSLCLDVQLLELTKEEKINIKSNYMVGDIDIENAEVDKSSQEEAELDLDKLSQEEESKPKVAVVEDEDGQQDVTTVAVTHPIVEEETEPNSDEQNVHDEETSDIEERLSTFKEAPEEEEIPPEVLEEVTMEDEGPSDDDLEEIEEGIK
jgi:DNA-directed RNA polymerase subunit beta